MSYSVQDKRKIYQKMLAKVSRDLEYAFENNEVEELLESYGIEIREDEYPIDLQRAKILVLGALPGKINDYKLAAKKQGVGENRIEFADDYNSLTNFNAQTLRYTDKYSDIILAYAPHKIAKMGDTSSLFAHMKNHPEEYPKVIVAKANGQGGELKLTISGFNEAIRQTRLYEYLNE